MKKIRRKRNVIGQLRLDYEKAKGQKKLDLLTDIRIEESKLLKILRREQKG